MLRDQIAPPGSVDSIIESLREARDKQIEDLLTEPGLARYLEAHYRIPLLSRVKSEFLRRDLVTLLQSPLDLVHYAPLIRELKSNNSLPIDLHPCFHSELDSLFQKYISR